MFRCPSLPVPSKTRLCVTSTGRSKINRLIAVKKRQLSILAEYRKAKIDEIILHGDKQAPQKDSGI